MSETNAAQPNDAHDSAGAGQTMDAAQLADDWRAGHTYDTPMDIAWQFSYEISQEKLDNLYAKAKQTFESLLAEFPDTQRRREVEQKIADCETLLAEQ